MSKPMTLEIALSMLAVSEGLRAKLVEERDALLAAPSPMFQPQSATPEGRELERRAFAKGLHHATMLRACHA